MADPARARKPGEEERGFIRKLTLNPAEVVARSGVAQWRRNRRSLPRRPAEGRGRIRRLRRLRVRFLLQFDDDDDDEELGHVGLTPRRQWPRVLATASGG